MVVTEQTSDELPLVNNVPAVRYREPNSPCPYGPPVACHIFRTPAAMDDDPALVSECARIRRTDNVVAELPVDANGTAWV